MYLYKFEVKKKRNSCIDTEIGLLLPDKIEDITNDIFTFDVQHVNPLNSKVYASFSLLKLKFFSKSFYFLISFMSI